jgi:putative transcriptional regulator
MVDVLANKRAAMRFRVLVEIAERQPAVSQGEIAEAVGVTSQAVSEYIRELVEDGLVEKEGRSRYRVTTEGVDWTLGAATDVRRFADHVTEDVLGSVQEDAAIATASIEEGQTVTLSMQEGLQHATPVGEVGSGGKSETIHEDSATGVATTDADAGEVVGVTGFEGVIDLEPGEVHVLQVPSIRSGLPDDTHLDGVREACEAADVVAAAGVEAVGALRAVGIDSVGHFAAGEVAADAASRGLDAVVVASVDNVGRVTDALRDAGAAYEVS